jgi:molecular chaperone GrpE
VITFWDKAFRRKTQAMAEEKKQPQVENGAGAEDDNAAAENSVEGELAKLRRELTAREEEAQANRERWLREAAELDNFKKRTARERDEAIRFANEALAKDLLPVIDNLERAIAHAQGSAGGKPLLEGVEMIQKSLLDVLSRHGLTPIAVATGQPFDPAKHEAMAQVERDDHEPNTVVEEHHKGYLFQSRLLRPALVSVAKPANSKDKKNAAAAG